MSLRPSLYDILTIEKDGVDVDFRVAATSIDYYEDIMCPAVSCTIQVVNAGGAVKNPDTGKKVSLYEGMKIRGGEKVRLKIRRNSNTNIDLDFSNEPLYVDGISELMRDDTSEFFKLHLLSSEAFLNEVLFLSKKYTKDSKVSDHVKTIISESFPSARVKEIEDTSNNFGFIGNQMKPFEAITKLASKSVSSIGENKTAGYFFFQTTEGFVYKSIDSLVNGKLRDQNPYVLTEYNTTPSEFKPRGRLNSLDYKINAFSINRNGELLDDLKKGTFSTERRFFNPNDYTVTDRSQNFTGDDYASAKTLGGRFSSEEIADIGGVDFKNIPSQILVESFDIGTVEEGVSRDTNQDILQYMSQRKMRYNTLFSQTVSITVPLNTNLRAGDLIECVFPSIGDSKRTEEETTQLSGIYMIKELCHHYEPKVSHTSMMLIRDTFGKRQK